ncbi:MAG: hypothetical protein WAN04_07245 [Candidatus Udaeobacter sp.]
MTHDEWVRAWDKHIEHLLLQFGPLAAFAIMMKVERETFVEMAGNSYDWIAGNFIHIHGEPEEETDDGRGDGGGNGGAHSDSLRKRSGGA